MDATHRAHNRRQYRFMLEAIRRYEAQQSDLRRLVDDLAALDSALEGISESWRDAYMEAWSDLEISYAMMCDRGVSVLDEAGRAAVNDSLVDLKRLVQGALDEVGTDE